MGSTVIGNHALFGGGSTSNGVTSSMISCDESLITSTLTSLSKARQYVSATSVGDYAVFAGGNERVSNIGDNVSYDTVDAYNNSLSRSTPTVLSEARDELAAASVGNYALFAGGKYRSSKFTYYSNIVDAYNKSLSRSTTALSQNMYGNISATIGNYALFGANSGTVLDAFNESLTRSAAPKLSNNSYSAASNSKYAIFITSVADAYDSSLVKSTANGYGYRNSVSNDYYAIFSCIYDSSASSSDQYKGNTRTYDTSLTIFTPDPKPVPVKNAGTANIGQYAIFGGGQNNYYVPIRGEVDIYEIR
jgi:hypothetical protein